VSRLADIGAWFEERLGLGAPLKASATHPVPRDTASWFYVFGSAAVVCLIIQIVTGVCLATVYAPSANEAWKSLISLDYEIPLGWFLRAVHGWGSNFMVAIVIAHMIQVTLFGAFKYPRELTWIVGVLLLFMTLGMAFTGQVMRFDQDAYWGLGIGAAIAGRTPLIGPQIVHLLLGGPIIGATTLSRFFTLHVFVVPGLLLGFVALHLLLVLRLGINEWPMPGRLVSRKTYREEYEALVRRDGVPFFPYAARRDMVAAGLVILAIVGCAAVFGPFGPNGTPDPTIIQTVPKPDFFFLWLYAMFALLPPSVETPLMLVGPVILVVLLLAVPFIAGEGEKSWKRRPGAVVTVVTALVVLGALTWLGTWTPWSPLMQAWSALPTPAKYLEGRTPLELRGALVVQQKQCRNCHALDGEGGHRGPDLDGVATRLTRDQLVRQVVQGGGNMPAYGKNLSPAEVTALVAFLGTLHPAGELPSRDAATPPTGAATR
jgi:ubiquinol-cytochrome c reductase cytochrome b subunit